MKDGLFLPLCEAGTGVGIFFFQGWEQYTTGVVY